MAEKFRENANTRAEIARRNPELSIFGRISAACGKTPKQKHDFSA